MKKFINSVKVNYGQSLLRYNAKPILSTAQYLVQMSNVLQMELMVSIIAGWMYSKVDSEGNHNQLIHEIVYHNKDKSAIKKWYGSTRSRNGNRVSKMTTRGWKILVEWKYGSPDWIELKDLEVSNPI